MFFLCLSLSCTEKKITNKTPPVISRDTTIFGTWFNQYQAFVRTKACYDREADLEAEYEKVYGHPNITFYPDSTFKTWYFKGSDTTIVHQGSFSVNSDSIRFKINDKITLNGFLVARSPYSLVYVMPHYCTNIIFINKRK